MPLPAPFRTRLRRLVRGAGVFAATACLATDAIAGTNDVAGPGSTSSSPLPGFFTGWFDRVDKTKSEQPRWAAPLVTSSPMPQEVFRYDLTSQSLANGHTLASIGGGKGMEFIPVERVQMNISLPAWQTQDGSPRKFGWADQNFLVKYRLFSANEQHGDYAVSASLGLAVPNGSAAYTTHHFIFSPVIGAGKGWGDFDLQASAGVSLPDNNAGRRALGTPLALNTTAQYRLAKVFWPQVEVNYTWWPNGTHEGLNQAFITPGLVVGRFPLLGRVNLSLGVGCQFAMTDHALYHRNLILTARLPF